MGTSFFINLDDVRRIAGLIGQTSEDLASSSTLGDSPVILAGSDPLAGRLHGHVSSFFQDWSDGMARISGHLNDIDGALQKAVGAYSETESKIVSAETPRH